MNKYILDLMNSGREEDEIISDIEKYYSSLG
jgi:hypothetical protein